MTVCWHNQHTLRGCCEGVRLWGSYGCTRDDRRWFWYAKVSMRGQWRSEEKTHGWSVSRVKALNAAREAVTRLAAGRDCVAYASHVGAAPRLLSFRAEWLLDHGFDFDATDIAKPANLAALKAAMVAAHPDKGGSSAAFIEARQRYVAACRAYRTHAN